MKWTEDRREHFIRSAHERGQEHHIRVGFDDDGRILALDVTFWHDNGAYTPYGIICPIVTSTQLLGPYKPGAYRVEFYSVYTTTVIVTPVPRRRAAAGRVRDGADDGPDRRDPRPGPHRRCARTTSSSRTSSPTTSGLIFQDGRPLIYDSGNYPAQLEMIKDMIGWDDFEPSRPRRPREGRLLGIGLGCYVEGTGPGPYEGAHVQVLTDGSVEVAIGLTSQGQGHQTVFAQIVADELGVPFESVRVTTGDTRRFGYAVGTFASRAAVMSGSAVALAARAVAGEGAPGRLRCAGVLAATIWRSSTAWSSVKGNPTAAIPLGQVAVLSNPLRYAFDEAAKAATQFARPADPDSPPVAEGEEPGLEAQGLLLAAAEHVRVRHARRHRRDRPGDRRDRHPPVLRGARLRHRDQPDDRRRAGARRRRAGHRRRAVRDPRLRRARPAAQRLVHGLPDAVRHGGARATSRSATRRRRRR